MTGPARTPLVTPSPDSSLFSSSPDPPILSQAHSSLSPVQGNNRSKRSKANYSNGRWSSHSTENESNNNNENNIPPSLRKFPKTTPPKHSENEIEEYCQSLCEKNKMLAHWNARLQSQLTSTVSQHQQETKSSLKRKSHDISSLTTGLASLKKKLQQTERSHHSLEQVNKNLKKDNQDLVKCPILDNLGPAKRRIRPAP